MGIVHPLVAKPHGPMYLMHSYDTRKPENVVKKYIENYCPPSGILLDPFAGAGTMIIETIASGRRGIGLDVNPLAIHITRSTLASADKKSLDDKLKEIGNRLKEKEYEIHAEDGKKVKLNLPRLYITKCHRCGSEAEVKWTSYSFKIICPSCGSEILAFKCEKGKNQGKYRCSICNNEFDLATAKVEGYQPVLIGYKCTSCEETRSKEPTKDDLERHKFYESLAPPFPVPTNMFKYPTGERFLTKRRIDSVDKLFDRRNLVTLSAIYHEICSLRNQVAKELFKIAFSAGLEFVCRLNPLRKRGEGYSTMSGLTVHELWAPAIHCLNNPIKVFLRRADKVIKGKEESSRRLRKVSFSNKARDVLNGKANIFLAKCSALDLERILCESCHKDSEKGECPGCIDFVFTDPPYGGSIQTYELDYFRNAWLFPNELDFWKEEAVINEKQGKDNEYYYKMIKESFGQLCKVLKPERYMVVTFHSSFIDVYNAIIRSAYFSGFNLERIVFQPPAVRSAKQSFHPFTSAVGDFFISFRKPKERTRRSLWHEYAEGNLERAVIYHVKDIIAERGEPTPLTVIFQEIYPRLEKDGYLLHAKPKRIQEILNEHSYEEGI